MLHTLVLYQSALIDNTQHGMVTADIAQLSQCHPRTVKHVIDQHAHKLNTLQLRENARTVLQVNSLSQVDTTVLMNTEIMLRTIIED